MTTGEAVRLVTQADSLRGAARRLGYTSIHLRKVRSDQATLTPKLAEEIQRVYGVNPLLLYLLQYPQLAVSPATNSIKVLLLKRVISDLSARSSEPCYDTRKTRRSGGS